MSTTIESRYRMALEAILVAISASNSYEGAMNAAEAIAKRALEKED